MTVGGRGGGIGQDWSEHEKKALTRSSGMPRTQKRGASDGGLQLVRRWEKASQCGALTNGRRLG